MSEWISVKDRLPEKSDDYLVYYLKKYECGFETKWINVCSFITSHDGWQTDNTETITHWQPLPEPPKEEQ